MDPKLKSKQANKQPSSTYLQEPAHSQQPTHSQEPAHARTPSPTQEHRLSQTPQPSPTQMRSGALPVRNPLSLRQTRLESYYVVSNPEPEALNGVAVLFAGHSQTKPGHQLGPKVVDHYLLHHVTAGRGEFATGGETYELGAGDSFLIGPGELVRYASDPADPWMYRWVAFRGEGAEALLASACLTPRRPVVHTGSSLRPGRAIRAIEQAFRSRSSGAALQATGHLQLLLAACRVARSAEETDSSLASPLQVEATVRQAIQYLSTQYAEPITIELMAETLGYNRAYLSKLFKRETGLTPVTFLLRLRLDKARRMLRERRDLTTAQIAASVGFQDPLYFSKQFHRHYGESPSDYRSTVRKF